MKVANSYKSLMGGVSRQVPEARMDGQHGEQVNFLSDPVRGLTRRPGSVLIRETAISSGTGLLADLEDFVGRDITVNGMEFHLLHRVAPPPVGTPAASIYAFERATGAYYPMVTDDSPALGAMLGRGISGITTAGQFLVVAGKDHVVGSTSTEQWSVSTNAQLGMLWVRGGAYSRTFNITLRFTGSGASDVTVSYTTPAAAYQGVLYTGDILTADPDYQKKVNDRVNDYNTLVTQWAGTAAAAIQPSAIATELTTLLSAAVSGGNFSVSSTGSHILVTGGTWTLAGITVNDGGDGTLFRAVHQSVAAADLLTSQCKPGKVVQVLPPGGTPFYMKATGLVGGTAVQEVRWEETGRDTHTPVTPFAIGAFYGGQLKLSTTVAGLQSMLGGSGLTVPSIAGRSAGDADTPGHAPPYFVGRTITYLGTFQDRLVVGSGHVLSCSRIGDYFNFYRGSALTVTDDDPVSAYSEGSEQDVIRHSVLFDKSLLLFGDKQQYSISGRVPLTPATATVMQSSAHSDAAGVRPVANGDLVLYAKSVEDAVQCHQIAVGNVDDTSNTTEITQQLGDYIPGVPVELVGLTKPDMLIVRSDASPYSLYAFRYIDRADKSRVMEAWNRWDYSPALGKIIGLGVHKGALRIMTARIGAGGTYIAIDEQSIQARTPRLPHLDSLRPYTYAGGTQSPGYGQMSAAFEYSTEQWRLQGAANVSAIPGLLADYPLADQNSLWIGAPQAGSFTLTSPFPRDREGNAITTGRTTVASLVFTFADTGGFNVYVDNEYTPGVALTFNGRLVNGTDNLVGIQPLSSGSVTAFVGREVREYEATVNTTTWLPCTITVVEWVGQYFNNTRRG